MIIYTMFSKRALIAETKCFVILLYQFVYLIHFTFVPIIVSFKI